MTSSTSGPTGPKSIESTPTPSTISSPPSSNQTLADRVGNAAGRKSSIVISANRPPSHPSESLKETEAAKTSFLMRLLPSLKSFMTGLKDGFFNLLHRVFPSKSDEKSSSPPEEMELATIKPKLPTYAAKMDPEQVKSALARLSSAVVLMRLNQMIDFVETAKAPGIYREAGSVTEKNQLVKDITSQDFEKIETKDVNVVTNALKEYVKGSGIFNKPEFKQLFNATSIKGIENALAVLPREDHDFLKAFVLHMGYVMDYYKDLPQSQKMSFESMQKAWGGDFAMPAASLERMIDNRQKLFSDLR